MAEWVKIPFDDQWANDLDVNASGYVIKCYQVGTTTPIPMAIDSEGATTVATATLNANGVAEVSGNEVALYVDQNFKYAIYENASDAANDTNAFYGPIDNVKVVFVDVSQVDTVANLKLLSLDSGQSISTQGYYSLGGGGGGDYLIKTAAEASADGDVIDGYGNHTIANGNVAILQGTENGIDVLTYGATPDGVTNSSPNIQAAVDASFTILFGDESNVFVMDDPVGLPDNDIRSDKFISIKGNGAKIISDSAEMIWTSKASLDTPDSTDNLFTGSITFQGLSFSGKTTALTFNVFNGDRLYNLTVTECSFDSINYIFYSHREKLTNPVFAEGYFQSVFFINDNRVHDVRRVFKGSKGMNISMCNNYLEGDIRLAFEIQSDFGASSVDALRIENNVFEGGGMLLRCGAVFGGSISGNYLEANDRYTALTYHAMMVFDSSVASAGLKISNNFIFNSDTGDASYATVKFQNFRDYLVSFPSDYENYWKGCSIVNNFCNNVALTEQGVACPVRDVNNNSVPSNENTWQPRRSIDNTVDIFKFSNSEDNTSGVSTGNQNLFKIRFDSDVKNNQLDRNFHAKVKMHVSHTSPDYPSLPTGNYQVGADYFEFDLLFFYRKGFAAVDSGIQCIGKVVTHIPATGPAGGGATYKDFWQGGSPPDIVVTPSGDDFIIAMSNYVNQTDDIGDGNGVDVSGTIQAECDIREINSFGDLRIISV